MPYVESSRGFRTTLADERGTRKSLRMPSCGGIMQPLRWTHPALRAATAEWVNALARNRGLQQYRVRDSRGSARSSLVGPRP
jgi:hypothetical protein